jgi:hypothetical protein
MPPAENIDGNSIESLRNLFSAKNSRVTSLAQSRMSRVGTDGQTRAIGGGSDFKQWLSNNIDFSVATASKISRFGNDSAMTSKMQSAVDGKLVKKGSKKKDLTETIKTDLLAQMDLRTPLGNSKLAKNLIEGRKQQERLNSRFNA